ncbi:hypothetical protein [Microcoleus sp. BROC3]|uniref:hypothetical protein n=1 Tax=Microcoleus sp. BROC3 TaxID=3055323 RepID=UPI002FD73747
MGNLGTIALGSWGGADDRLLNKAWFDTPDRTSEPQPTEPEPTAPKPATAAKAKRGKASKGAS